jgi:hypothetical protein
MTKPTSGSSSKAGSQLPTKTPRSAFRLHQRERYRTIDGRPYAPCAFLGRSGFSLTPERAALRNDHFDSKRRGARPPTLCRLRGTHRPAPSTACPLLCHLLPPPPPSAPFFDQDSGRRGGPRRVTCHRRAESSSRLPAGGSYRCTFCPPSSALPIPLFPLPLSSLFLATSPLCRTCARGLRRQRQEVDDDDDDDGGAFFPDRNRRAGGRAAPTHHPLPLPPAPPMRTFTKRRAHDARDPAAPRLFVGRIVLRIVGSFGDSMLDAWALRYVDTLCLDPSILRYLMLDASTLDT